MNLDCMTPPSDKREATKWRNRRAIVDAASELAAQHGVEGFTVRDLAERAGVSRRTFFNHFSTIADAVYESFSARIDAMYRQIEDSLGDARFESMAEAYAAFAEALRPLDILGTANSLLVPMDDADRGQVSGASEPPQVAEIWMNRIMDGIVRSCVDSLQSRVPSVDPFEIRLLVELVAVALTTSVNQWAEITDGALTEANRREWDRLLDCSLSRLDAGFGQHGAA